MHLASAAVSSVLAVALLPALMLADAKETYRDNPVVHEGELVLLRSAGWYLAVYLDEGRYAQYENRGMVRRANTCWGGDVTRCEDATNCVDFSGVYFMEPPSDQTAWRRGPYELRLASSDPATGDSVITATRYDGLEAYSYGYSTACGVTWINFSNGGQNGEAVFYPQGRSLFWTQACTDGAAIVRTK